MDWAGFSGVLTNHMPRSGPLGGLGGAKQSPAKARCQGGRYSFPEGVKKAVAEKGAESLSPPSPEGSMPRCAKCVPAAGVGAYPNVRYRPGFGRWGLDPGVL